jgi:transposase
MRLLDARSAAVIRIEAVWLAAQPLDMRIGRRAAMVRVANVFVEARSHHAYLFANRRANSMKVLVHDGIDVWLAARRLNSGKFVWQQNRCGAADPQPVAIRCPGVAPIRWTVCGLRIKPCDRTQ